MCPKGRLGLPMLLILSILTLGQVIVISTANAQTAATYYVDCSSGNDANDGLSLSSAWRSVERAGMAKLNPGDSLLFKRGCTWTNTNTGVYLNARWVGTAEKPIVIGAYGDGDNPIIRSDAQGRSQNQINILLTGSHLLLENLSTTLINPYKEPTCRQADGTGIPKGWYVGVQVPGSYNTIKNLEAYHLAVGISTLDNTSHNKILSTYLHDLDTLWTINFTSGSMGAIGILLHGDDSEAAYNLIERNQAECRAGSQTANYSAPFEIYNANRNYIHHNRAYEHRKQIEMGHDPLHTTDDNVLAYNLFVSSQPNAKGPNLHTIGNPFGPVNRTLIFNNTIVLTGPNSEAIVASGGGTFRNNIFVAELKTAFYGKNTVESNNLYWDPKKTADTLPDPCIQFAGGGCSSIATFNVKDPLFINPSVPNGDFRLQSSSPAHNQGMDIETTDAILKEILATDLSGASIASGRVPDIGAYEVLP